MKNKTLNNFIMKYKKFKILNNIYKIYTIHIHLNQDIINMQLNFLLLISKEH
jgi:hypothetical protein